jgi:hypothetical protein
LFLRLIGLQDGAEVIDRESAFAQELLHVCRALRPDGIAKEEIMPTF